MRRNRYLNIILTVNAVLLAMLVWTQVVNTPVMATEAAAQHAGGSGGMVTAAEQRQRIIDSLRDLQQAVNTTNRLLDRGTMRVHVTNASELRMAGAADDDSVRERE